MRAAPHRRRPSFGGLIAGVALLLSAAGTIWFLATEKRGAPDAENMRMALGALMRDEAETGGAGALGAQLVFEPPARLSAELVDARIIREISAVERLACVALESGAYRCAYIATGERWCEGPGCAALGDVAPRLIEERATAIFTPVGFRDWRAERVEE